MKSYFTLFTFHSEFHGEMKCEMARQFHSEITFPGQALPCLGEILTKPNSWHEESLLEGNLALEPLWNPPFLLLGQHNNSTTHVPRLAPRFHSVSDPSDSEDPPGEPPRSSLMLASHK